MDIYTENRFLCCGEFLGNALRFPFLGFRRKMEEVMKTSDFAYDLPEELIAQDPLADRASSRLLVLDKKTGERAHKNFHEIVHYLRRGDCLVINDTKVIPARLIGQKEGTGERLRCFF